YQLRMLTNELLSYWNESINADTEKFWAELHANDIDFERKEPLRYAMTKKRFRNVEQSIDARINWVNLKEQHSISDKYSKSEIEQIDNIIADDEKNRHEVLKRSLQKGKIPQTQYLKFGECIAFFSRC